MKYFTPQLWLQTQAGVDGPTFSAAYEEWERAVDAYEKSLEQTIPKGRDHWGVRKFAKNESLHDAIVLRCWYETPSHLFLLVEPEAPETKLGLLDYTLAREPMLIRGLLPPEFCTTHPRWMYDEIGRWAESSDDEPYFTHNILLSTGCELVICFSKLDWTRRQDFPLEAATLIPKPVSQAVRVGQ
jgi:hypothetical protein